MTGRSTPPVGTRAFGAARILWLCIAAAFCVSACADIWGFDELRSPPDDAGSGRDVGTLPVVTDGGDTDGAGAGGDSGGLAGMGAGGSVGSGGAGGVTGTGGARDAGGSSGSGGTSGVGGVNGTGGGVSGSGGSGGIVGGVGGRIGTGGNGGAGTGGAAGGIGTGGAAAGGAGGGGTGGRLGTGGTGGAGVCTPGTNRCVGGDLQTCSTTGAWQSTGTATRQLLVNPSFESGVTAWTISVAGGFDLIYVANGNGGATPAIAAQSPTMVAWFGGYNRADDIGSQSVAIPADATSINLSFYYAIFTREGANAPENDVMDVTVTAGAQTITVAHFSNVNPVATWTRFSAALPATLAGQTVRLQFRDLTNATSITSFYIDTVALQVVACP